MICQAGKKPFYMGSEFGQWNEWNCKGEFDFGYFEQAEELFNSDAERYGGSGKVSRC
jgi:1,4-alpha-glucan branching enzyme